MLSVRSLSLTLAGRPILDAVDLDVAPGRIVALLGRSGVGKTMLLRVIAGFQLPTAVAALTLSGQPIRGPQPDVGLVLADHGLFPWFSLRRNLLFGSRARSARPAEREQRLARLMEDFGLTGLEERYADELSHGQRQRGAMVRALMNRPKLLLADEPFGALDAISREEARSHFIHARSRDAEAAVLFVTHDIDEALLTADEIRVVQTGDHGAGVGAPYAVEAPRSPSFAFSARYLEARAELRASLSASRASTDNTPTRAAK